MSKFISNIIQRHVDQSATVLPRLPGKFESGAGISGGFTELKNLSQPEAEGSVRKPGIISDKQAKNPDQASPVEVKVVRGKPGDEVKERFKPLINETKIPGPPIQKPDAKRPEVERETGKEGERKSEMKDEIETSSAKPGKGKFEQGKRLFESQKNNEGKKEGSSKKTSTNTKAEELPTMEKQEREKGGDALPSDRTEHSAEPPSHRLSAQENSEGILGQNTRLPAELKIHFDRSQTKTERGPKNNDEENAGQNNTIHVNIGRIEVRAIREPAQITTKKRVVSRPNLSLDDYLKRKEEG
jgi:hypothetical protein